MKDFNSFIKEDFNSAKATEFPIKIQNKDRIMFYEPASASSFSLPRFASSFMKKEVANLMKTEDNNFRSVIAGNTNGLHCFVWSSLVLHSNALKYLDANPGKYPSLGYNRLYNEAQMYSMGDKISNWIFPFIIWNGTITVNISPLNIIELDEQKDIKNIFKLSDFQWNSLLKKSVCKI